jgi:hypothetical protein
MQAVVISLAAVGITALGGGLARLRDGQAEPSHRADFWPVRHRRRSTGRLANPRFPEAALLSRFCAADAGSGVSHVAAGQPPAGRNPHRARGTSILS